jgi:hypothetical protein
VAPRPEYKPQVLPVGRPSKDIQSWRYRMQERFREVVSIEDLDEIIGAAVLQAKIGNSDARNFVAAYCFGKPPQLDKDEIAAMHVDGNLNVALIKLTDEQLEALAAIDPNAIDADYHVVEHPSLPEPSGGS